MRGDEGRRSEFRAAALAAAALAAALAATLAATLAAALAVALAAAFAAHPPTYLGQRVNWIEKRINLVKDELDGPPFYAQQVSDVLVDTSRTSRRECGLKFALVGREGRPSTCVFEKPEHKQRIEF